MTRTVARLLAESLEAHDVDQIFCVPGESYVGFTSAVLQRNTIRMMVCRHEGGAGYMAVADGRLRKRAGCCIVSRGPGPVQRDGVAALGLSRRDADGDAGRPGGAQGFRPAGVAGTKLLAPAGRRHQAGDRGERAGTGVRSDRARLPHCGERHAGAGRGDPAGGHLRRNHRCGTGPAAAARCWPGRAPRISTGWRRCWRSAERPLVLVGGALLADALYDDAVYGDLRRFAEDWVLPICPTHRRPHAVRRAASELRRLYGHPRAARADHRNEARRPDGRAGRAADRHGQPVVQFPRRAAAATAAGACLAGCQRGRARVPARPWHRRQPA